MDLTNISEENLKEKLEENQSNMDNLLNQCEKNNEKQVEIFKEYLKKFKIVIDFLHKREVYFRHPKYKYTCIRGPILYYNGKENDLYVYDVESGSPIKISMYNTEKTERVLSKTLFQNFKDSFECAIEGIMYTAKIQEVDIKEIEERSKQQEALLNKYKLD